jgi:pimeloyl-[acyl-carrier protein] synthase
MATTVNPLAAEVAALREYAPEIRDDPYRIYRRMRDEAPVYVDGSDVWLTRFEDVESGFLDTEQLSSRRLRGVRYKTLWQRLSAHGRALLDEMVDDESLLMGRQDGDDHRRLRGLAHQALTPRRVAALEPRIQQITDGLLDRFVAEGQSDLVANVAYQLPLIVIDELFGVPPAEQQLIRELAAATAAQRYYDADSGDAEQLIARAHERHQAFRHYVETLIERARTEGTDSTLVVALLAAEQAGDRLSDEEIFSMISNILFAGHETTAKLIGNGVYSLLKHPEQWALLCDDPALVPQAVEEVLRYEPVVQMMDRLAPDSFELQGVTIPAGSSVRLCIGSANRDPRQFEDPDRFDITRTPERTLSFGIGPHFCIGNALARLEARTFFTTFVERFPRAQLDPERPAAWAVRLHRGLSTLHVQV